MSALKNSRWVFAIVSLCFVLGVLATPHLEAQSRYELAGGFSYFRVGIRNGFNLYGWHVNPDINVADNIAIALDSGGYYESYGFSLHSLMAGPRFKYRTDGMTFFAHSLVGGEVGHAGSHTQGAFAVGFGGGIDVNANDRFAIRVFQLDSIHDHIDRYWGHNVRGSAGVVFKFGER